MTQNNMTPLALTRQNVFRCAALMYNVRVHVCESVCVRVHKSKQPIHRAEMVMINYIADNSQRNKENVSDFFFLNSTIASIFQHC